jgi:hypothetical protein
MKLPTSWTRLPEKLTVAQLVKFSAVFKPKDSLLRSQETEAGHPVNSTAIDSLASKAHSGGK